MCVVFISGVERSGIPLLSWLRMKRIAMLVILGLLVWAGFYLRFIDLGQKPMHADEAVNGLMVYQSFRGESVNFDPSHFHGPLLRYLAIPVIWVAGQFTEDGLSEASLRWLTALAGSCIVVSLILFRKCMGVDATFIALVFMAVSPPLIYYSRYFIHESVFVLLSLFFIFVVWRFFEEKNWRYALWTGVCLGLLHATRETVVLVIIAVVLALFASFGQDWRKEFIWMISKEGRVRLGAMALISILVSVLFYSSFFTHWQGVLDSVLTYFHYEKEAGHEKPWYYYLGLILGERSRNGYLGQGWLILLGAAGLWQAFLEKTREVERIPFFRCVGVYTLATTVFYSGIAYKTPWLMLNFLVGWILLSGIGWVYLWSRFSSVIVRGLLVLVLLFSLVHSVRQSWLLGLRYSADPRNPFAYSHTSPDLLKFVERMETLSRLHPDGKSMRIDIAGIEYWPLPWYLRGYSRVGYWQGFPTDLKAPVLAFSFTADQERELPTVDESIYLTELRGLREGVFLLICIDKVLWEKQFQDG